MGSSALKVSPKPSGYNSNNSRPKMNGYGNMYGAGYGDLSAYSAYGGMSAYGQPLDPAMYGAPAAATYASASAAYAQQQQQQPQVQAVQQIQQGVGNFPGTPQQLAAYQQQQAAHYQQQQAAGANLPPPRDFSTLTPIEQDTLLQQMGLDRSQVATNVQMQPAAAAAQTQQQYQYAVAPSQAAAPQQPVEQQQQYLPVPEAPPHYSNRYNHSREAQGQPAQVVYQQQQQQAHQLPQRQVQTPPPPQYVYERYAPPPPPLRREHRHRGDGRVYFPPREATIDELLDFLPPRPGVYQARPPRQRLPPISHDLVYSKPRRVIDDDDYEGYVIENRYMKRRPSLSTRSKSHECCPPHHRPRNARFYSDEDFYSDYSDYSDY